MSVESANKSFVSGVVGTVMALGPNDIDFSKNTFGIWFSLFENVNNGYKGYSLPEPIVEDIVSSSFALTGKKFSVLNTDGRKPDIRFFLTSGQKGINGYDYVIPLAEITNTFISGHAPSIIMPDMDFSGKLYRRTEVLGTGKSFITKNNIAIVSGEDWAPLNYITVSGNYSDDEYTYADTGYSGYSNECNTRYKFLYNDSGNSLSLDTYSFEIPYEIEADNVLKYRIARKSDPVGTFSFPYLTDDGKAVIDYTQLKDEMSGIVSSNLYYQLTQPLSISVTQKTVEEIFEEKTIARIPISNSNYSGITGVSLSALNSDGFEFLQIDLLGTGDFNTVTKVTTSVQKYNLTGKQNVTGYVMSGYKLDASSPAVQINLVSGDFVYPRVVEDGSVYNRSDISTLVDIDQEIDLAKSNEDLQIDSESDESQLVKTIEDNLKRVADAINNELSDSETSEFSESEDVIKERNNQDKQDQLSLLQDNNAIMEQKFTLPNFPLPKKTYSVDYYSNYLNSGEQYVLTPLINYTSTPIYSFYGEDNGVLVYYINNDPERGVVTNQPNYRTVINSTCDGVYINDFSFCKGDTAIYDNRRYSDTDRKLENGLVTKIPSNGIIKKDSYLDSESWASAVNYFYQKTYVSSFTVLPSFSEQEYANLFNSAFSKVRNLIGGPVSDYTGDNSFYKKGGRTARIFVEREIYTEPYNSRQVQELNRSLITGVFTPEDLDLSVQEEDKLYCVQNYDVSNFVKVNSQSFYPVQNYNEFLEFQEFIPESTSVSTGYIETKSTVDSYILDTNSQIGTVLFTDKNQSYKKIYRAEYVTGSSSNFSYINYASAEEWSGPNEDIISIANQDTKNYAYHLYGYNQTTGILRLIKSNVQNGYEAKVSPYTNAVVLKFNKLELTNQLYQYDLVDQNTARQESFSALNTLVSDNNSNIVTTGNIKFNVQAYNYSVVSPAEINHWHIFSENPINNNTYGSRDSKDLIQPRFFQDETAENKESLESLFYFPNGPHTSKNYEGSPLDITHINGLTDGLFENNIYIREELESSKVYESNCTLDFIDNGKINKLKTVPGLSNKNNSVNFAKTRRLKITKVRYNFYVKDLVIIGDAGSPYSINFNEGWEYKLQYRLKNSSDAWVTIEDSGPFTKDAISAQGGPVSPFYFSASDLAIPSYLSMVGFRTNLPLFLDDNDYEFRVAKYEKLAISTLNVDVIKKTNFFPIKVEWTQDPDCLFYNIYQKDSGNNLTLIKTENDPTKAFSYAIPDIKQTYIDQGVTYFTGVGQSGYYDLIVSGIVPAVTFSQNSISNEYGFEIGDSNSQLSVNKIDENTNYLPKQISSPTYSFILNFNNPETRISNFTIDQNYNGYYFISSGASLISLQNLNSSFEAYVANVNSISCSVGSTTVNANNVGIIQGTSSPTTAGISSNPSATFDLSDLSKDGVLYLKETVNITDISSLTASENFTLKVINDSNSSITVSYKSSSSVSVSANQTVFLSFDSSTVSLVGSALSNIYVQDDYIHYPSGGLLNLDHSDLYLDPAVSLSNFPIYNLSKNELTVNDSLSLESDSFNYVNWNGSTATKSVKTYFDDIKIHIFGNETPDKIFYLKDDTEIIISEYDASEAVFNQYYFIKDESVKRNLNIKITNGSSTFVIPRKNQDFRLKIRKSAVGGVISYDILYPSNDPFFEINDDLEQLIILNSGSSQNIDLYYIESQLPKNAFVYFINKSGKSISFYKGNISNVQYTLAENQVARAFIATVGLSQSIKIDILNNVYSHFEFEINPAIHLTGSINILNLDFCGSEIRIPSVSNFTGNDLFLICKNRTSPNRIDPQSVFYENNLIQTADNPETLAVNEVGNIADQSISLRLYKQNTGDRFPTIERTSFLSFNQTDSKPLILNDNTPEGDQTDYFYINDTGNSLSSFGVRDYYDRKSKYNGKIFLQSQKKFTAFSFDENHSITTSQNKTSSKQFSNSLTFDCDSDNFVNGNFNVEEKDDAFIINSKSENGSSEITFSYAVYINQILINFSYDSVIVSNISSKRLNKNRLVKISGLNITYPIYNKNEFFLSRSRIANTENTFDNETFYYVIKAEDIDVAEIIIPDTMAYLTLNTNRKFVIKNYSSRNYIIRTISYNGSTYSTYINANEQALFSYNGSWSKASDSSDFSEITPLSIRSSNQQFEIDPNHPLSSLWLDGFSFDSIPDAFVGQTGTETTLTINTGTSDEIFNIIDFSSSIAAVNENRIYCFGRVKTIETKKSFIVNTFYLYVLYKQTVIKYMQAYSSGIGVNNAEIKDLKVIEEQHVDLTKYFKTSVAISALPSVIFIPVVSPLSTFYLPNLSLYIFDFTADPPTASTLGSLIDGKKIIFVNLVGYNIPAKIVNYSDSTTSNLSTGLTSLTFTASSTTWTQGLNEPEIHTVYPTLRNISGRNSVSTSEIKDGSEFVYVPNLSKFAVDSSTFERGDFKDFYLFNSALNNLTITSNATPLYGNRFIKVSRNPIDNGYLSYNIGTNGTAPFSVVDLVIDDNIIEVSQFVFNYVRNAFPFLKYKSFIKVAAERGGSRFYYLYSFDLNNLPVLVGVDEDFAYLYLDQIKEYLPDHKLFVYGSSQVNDQGLFFDYYPLKVLNSDLLENEKFYIQNNTPSALNLYFKSSDKTQSSSIILPSKRMLEISKNSVVFMEHHQKGKFYIGNSKNGKNFIQTTNTSLFLDNLFDYSKPTQLNSEEQIQTASSSVTPSILLTFLINNITRCNYCYYQNSVFVSDYKIKNQAFLISDLSDMVLDASKSLTISKTKIKITSAGHYIFNNDNSDLVVTTTSSDIFLVNNCPRDIYVAKNSNALTLYRNSVLVVKTAADDRFLKKAKRRDEFYCVFNPKTAIYTAREITLNYAIPRSYDVLPIMDINNFEQQSYVKLLSRNGQKSITYLNVEDYYYGRDIPTDSPENVLAYEVGIGHETFYKFLFFDPSRLTYTLPGIMEGQTYEVSVDDGLMRDLQNLPNIYGRNEKALKPCVIYNGKEYGPDFPENGTRFQGTNVSNYEIRYPNYVKLSKVISEIGKSFPNAEEKADEETEQGLILQEEPVDDKSVFNQQIIDSIRPNFRSPLAWIPQNENAFWSESTFTKDLWQITEVMTGAAPVSIKYPDEISPDRYVNFIQCRLKKDDLKTIVFDYSWDRYSALQPKDKAVDARDLTIGLDADIEPSKINKIKSILQAKQNSDLDILLNNEKMLIGYIYKDSIIPTAGTVEALKRSEFQISFSIFKLDNLPFIEFDDFSKNAVIEIINQPINSLLAENPN